jgi:parallel beta-helix repeat protein
MAGVSVALLALAAPAARATSSFCGAVIVADFTLDQDLTCGAAGLIVGADGVKINLQGHAITGSGAGAGVTVAGRSEVSIFGGTIAKFATGVLINGSAEVVIKDTILSGNVDGIDVQAGSSGVTIKANQFLDNSTRGIMLRGGISDNQVKNNSFTRNRVGILLFGPTNTIVKDNTFTASLLAGMRVNFLATSNLVLDNRIASNPAGIEFLAGSTGGAAGNWFIANTVTANTCGIKGPYTANTFKDNQLSGNASTTCL